MNCFNLVVLYIRLLFLIENIKYMTIKQIMLVVSILKDIGLLQPKKIVIFSSSWDKTPFDIIRFKSVRISYIFGQSQKTWEIVSLGAGLSFPKWHRWHDGSWYGAKCAIIAFWYRVWDVKLKIKLCRLFFNLEILKIL